MAGLFDKPDVPAPVTPVNPADTKNRLNSFLADRLQSGGTNATLLSSYAQNANPTGGSRAPTLTGIS